MASCRMRWGTVRTRSRSARQGYRPGGQVGHVYVPPTVSPHNRSTNVAVICHCYVLSLDRTSGIQRGSRRPVLAGQRRSQSYPERSSARIELSGAQKAVRTQCATPAAPADPNYSNILRQRPTRLNDNKVLASASLVVPLVRVMLYTPRSFSDGDPA